MSCNCCPPVIISNTDGGAPACVSAEPGNALTQDADGCLTVPTDPAGPIRPGPGGLTMCLSAAAGNAAGLDPAGCLLVPSPPAPLTGCGLTGDGSAAAPIQASTAGAWGSGALAYPCEDTSGEPVYCDGAGQLRTAPPPMARGFSQFAQESVSGPPEAQGSTRVTHDVTLAVTNPSPCRSMLTSTRVNLNGIAFTQTAGNDWAVTWGISFSTDGTQPPPPGVGSGLMRRRTPADLVSADEWEFAPIDAVSSAGAFGYVAPGQTVMVRAAFGITFHAVNPAAGADGVAPAWRIREAGLYTWGLAI